MYGLIFDDCAIDFLNKLQKEVKERIFNKLISTKENPFRYFERLEGRLEFKLRVGKHRIIADITPTQIEVRLIGHRKNIYSKL